VSSSSQPSFSGDERQTRPDLKLNPLKLHEIIYDKDCYVYSTSYRFCISQFAFAPSTTVGPMNLDFSRAVNITWNRKDRNRLPLLHHEVCEAARIWGLDQLYRLAVLAFAGTGGRPRDRLETLAQGATQTGDYFPFSAGIMASIRSFVPTKWPSSNQLREARASWSGGLAKAQEGKETRQDRAAKLGDYCRFEPTKTSVTMWRMWEEGQIDLTAGAVVKVVTTPKDGMCHVNKPGKWPVLVTMELVTTEWLQPVNANFKECEYCGAIDHETSDCPYRGKVPYGRKGDFSWRIEDGKTILE
jgi:hypothetical protein